MTRSPVNSGNTLLRFHTARPVDIAVNGSFASRHLNRYSVIDPVADLARIPDPGGEGERAWIELRNVELEIDRHDFPGSDGGHGPAFGCRGCLGKIETQ